MIAANAKDCSQEVTTVPAKTTRTAAKSKTKPTSKPKAAKPKLNTKKTPNEKLTFVQKLNKCHSAVWLINLRKVLQNRSIVCFTSVDV